MFLFVHHPSVIHNMNSLALELTKLFRFHPKNDSYWLKYLHLALIQIGLLAWFQTGDKPCLKQWWVRFYMTLSSSAQEFHANCQHQLCYIILCPVKVDKPRSSSGVHKWNSSLQTKKASWSAGSADCRFIYIFFFLQTLRLSMVLYPL